MVENQEKKEFLIDTTIIVYQELETPKKPKIIGLNQIIGNHIYDWGNYFDFSDDNCDEYDRCMVFMAKEIEVVKVNPNWFS